MKSAVLALLLAAVTSAVAQQPSTPAKVKDTRPPVITVTLDSKEAHTIDEAHKSLDAATKALDKAKYDLYEAKETLELAQDRIEMNHDPNDDPRITKNKDYFCGDLRYSGKIMRGVIVYELTPVDCSTPDYPVTANEYGSLYLHKTDGSVQQVFPVTSSFQVIK
jgi:hypothetical protein